MKELLEQGSQIFLGNELRDWAITAALFVIFVFAFPLLRSALHSRLEKAPARHATAVLEVAIALFDRTTRLFLIALAAWLSLRWLKIPPEIDRKLGIGLQVIAWFQFGLWGMTLVSQLLHSRLGGDAAAEGAASLNILRFVGFMLVWTIVLLMLLANLGVEIMPLVAGLGIGGIAIALAVQNVLGDLLASLSIALDKPFKVGDFLVTGEERGRVEHIGIKSTRLRSTTGEQIIMSNGDLLKSRLRNYGHRAERRAELTIRIVYETPRALIAAVPGIIEAAVRSQEKTRFERAHFARYGDWALVFEGVYFVLDSELKVFMDVQQAVNLQLMDEFARREIQFAYPTSRAVSVTLPAPPATA